MNCYGLSGDNNDKTSDYRRKMQMKKFCSGGESNPDPFSCGGKAEKETDR